MIIEFSFENFRSYKSKAKIDFVAKSISEFEDSLITPIYDDIKLLPVCAIYGPNGGGKSGVIYALKTFKSIVIEPIIQLTLMKNKNDKLSDTEIDDLNTEKSLKSNEYYYKWNDEGKDLPTKFSMNFQINDVRYKYSIALKDGIIIEENLLMNKLSKNEFISVFERDMEGIYLCKELEVIDVDRLNSALPLLSYISILKDISYIDTVVRFFMNIRVINFDIPTQDRKIVVDAIEENKKLILDEINKMGIDICDIRFEKDENGKVKNVFTKHSIVDGSYRELKLEDESSGTRKVFSLLPYLFKGIEKGDLFLIDELDAKLHPKLLRRIIELFTNSSINKSGAQLLFTSHDMTTMCKEVFRRDEIWFSAINGYDESILYSLIEFKKENGDRPRKDENYNKQYLEGRYGADPYMNRMMEWEEK